MRRPCTLLLAALLLASWPSAAAPPRPGTPADAAKPRTAASPAGPDSRPATTALVVYDLRAEQGLEPLAARLSEAILLHLGKLPGLQVMGESELQVLIAHEQDKVVMMCEGQEACLARIGQAARADQVITGHVGRLGETYLVTLKLADASRATVVSGETASADKVEELPAETTRAAARLVGATSADAAPRFRMQVAPAGTKAAVVDLAAHGVAPGLAQSLTQLLSLELKKFEGLGVISRDEMQTMIRFSADKQALQCSNDTSCLAQIGGALGVDYLISGSVGRLGDQHVLTLKLIDIEAAHVASRVSEAFQGPEQQLPMALRFAAGALLGREAGGEGRLTLQANLERGEVSLDGQPAVPYPFAKPLPPLEVGKHVFTVTGEGYAPKYQEAYIEVDRTTEVIVELTELPRPWYQKWWTWTIAATSLAAAVTATILLLPEEPTEGTVTALILGTSATP